VKWTKLLCRRFKDDAAQLQLFALAYNLANFLRQLALPKPIQSWALTTLREKLVQIGAKVVSHAKYRVFQLAEVAVPRGLFSALVERIGRLRLACSVIENLNSRLRSYFFLRRHLGGDHLALLQFFLNHRRLVRSAHAERVGKSPAELLTGQSQPHWLEMLGYSLFSRN
jgi:hypothetical protein